MYAYTLVLYIYCIHVYFSYINDYSKFLWVQWDWNIAHQACAKYSTLNIITHVNCAKTGDMEIAHVNVLEIAHHFLCALTNRCELDKHP